jgi:hypothetical protein
MVWHEAWAARGPGDPPPRYEMCDFLKQAVQERRPNPGSPGVVSKLLAGDDPRFALLELSRQPRLRTQLRNKPKRIAGFVDEVLRQELPSPLVTRTTTVDVTVAGVRGARSFGLRPTPISCRSRVSVPAVMDKSGFEALVGAAGRILDGQSVA